MEESFKKKCILTIALLLSLSTTSLFGDENQLQDNPSKLSIRSFLKDGWHRATTRTKPKATPTKVGKAAITQKAPLVTEPVIVRSTKQPLVVIASPEEYPKLRSIQTIPNSELTPFANRNTSISSKVTGISGPSNEEVFEKLQTQSTGWQKRQTKRMRDVARQHGFGLLSTDIVR